MHDDASSVVDLEGSRVVPLGRPVKRERRQHRLLRRAYMVKGGTLGGYGGGGLEHRGQWPSAQWAGLFLGVPSCPEPPGAP
eukprot:scaffold24419_cov43-Phaeocystis_antarctica.AAC.1